MGGVLDREQSVHTQLCKSSFRRWDIAVLRAVFDQVRPLHEEGVFVLDYSAYHAVFRMEREPDADTLWRLTEQSNHEQRSTLILLSALIGLSQAKLRDRAELLFRVYDFDGSGELSHEDLTVMALCLTRAFGLISTPSAYSDLSTDDITAVARAWCGDTGSLPRSSFVDRVWAESKIFPKISEAASTPAPEASRGRFTVGQTVAAAVRPGDAHFPGTITAAHGDGTYDVTLDDDVGDTARNVPGHQIRALAPQPLTAEPPRLGPPARHSGAPPPAAAAAADAGSGAASGAGAGDGAGAGAGAGAAVGAASSKAVPTSGDGVVAEEVTYGVGQKVLALFKPGKYLAAVITAAHDDGTFDVEYYDGDWDEHVPVSKLKPRLVAKRT